MGLEERPVLIRRLSLRSLATLRLVFGREDARDPDMALHHPIHVHEDHMFTVTSQHALQPCPIQCSAEFAISRDCLDT